MDNSNADYLNVKRTNQIKARYPIQHTRTHQLYDDSEFNYLEHYLRLVFVHLTDNAKLLFYIQSTELTY